MITIDCKDVEPILNELAIYVSDQIAAIPAIKLHKFVLEIGRASCRERV